MIVKRMSGVFACTSEHAKTAYIRDPCRRALPRLLTHVQHTCEHYENTWLAVLRLAKRYTWVLGLRAERPMYTVNGELAEEDFSILRVGI